MVEKSPKSLICVLIIGVFYLLCIPHAYSEDDLCKDRYLDEIYQLSLKKKESAQFKSLISTLVEKKYLYNNSRVIFKAYQNCLVKFNTIHSKAGLSVELVDEKLVFKNGDASFDVIPGPLTKLHTQLKKADKALKFESSEQRDAFWFVWVESAIAATGHKFNYYVYADLMELAFLQNGGRSFAVGFTPKFEEEVTLVESVTDEDLQKSGLKPGAEIIKIRSRTVDELDKFSWWLQQAPFKYELIYRQDGIEKSVEAQSITFTTKEFFSGFIGDIAYVRFNSFNARSSIEFSRFMRKVTPETKGIILDVRFNSGGVINPGVPDYFLKPAQVVLAYKYLKEDIVSLPGSVAYFDLPVVMLQNRYSASMSEILVAALKEQNRGTVIGETSFGKGVGQTVFPVLKEGMVALVESRYFYPDGISTWHEKGIDPDILMKPSEKETNQVATHLFGGEIDLSVLMSFDGTLSKANDLLLNGNVSKLKGI